MRAVRRVLVRHVRPGHALLLGAFVAGWSAARASGDAAPEPPPERVAPTTRIASKPAVARPGGTPRIRKRPLVEFAGVAVTLLVGIGVLTRPGEARAPLVPPAVAAHEHASAARAVEGTRLRLLRHLQLSGIAARHVGRPPAARPKPLLPPLPVLRPGERTLALDTYIQALGTNTILRGLDASRSELERKVLSDPRVHVYPGGRGDVSSGRVDVRVLAMIEYLAQADGEVSVSCLISGHSYFVHGRPGVVSAHSYGRAVDISAVAGISILGNQGRGTITERAIRQVLALPAAVLPNQVISLMTLGGPSFALPDHYNHIHLGY